MRDELQKGIEHYKAKAGGAAIMDVNTGEIIAYASLPDYDPNNPVDALDPNHINRLNVGVYEMGSTFKAITIAMALEANKVNLQLAPRRARRAALRPLRDPRLPRAAPRADACRKSSRIRRTSARRAWR